MPPRALRLLALLDDPADLERLDACLDGLEGRASELASAATLERAVEALARDAYDVLLVGERVGKVSGHEILCDLRRAGHAVPVVMFGARDDEESVASAMRAGAAEHLAWSSTTPARLEAALAWALERRRGALPARADDSETLCNHLQSAVAPTLEAARASLACVLAETSLSADQRRELGEVEQLCGRALAELERVLDEVRGPGSH